MENNQSGFEADLPKRFTITHRLNDVGLLEEAVFASMPEGEMASSVRNQQIIVERVEGCTRKTLLQRLRNVTQIYAHRLATQIQG
jgi:hypothetical protein